MNSKNARQFYYHKKSGNYWLEIAPREYIELKDRALKLQLRRHWNPDECFKTEKGGNFCPIDSENMQGVKLGDEMLMECQEQRGVDYAGALAGHRSGLMKFGPKKVLVTQEIQPVAAVKGDWPFLDKFTGQLLGGEQGEVFLLWLKIARQSLLEGDFMPGQMLVLAGESGCGKSFTHLLITHFLGGRVAKPYRYMTGETQFNGDLAQSEHWVIADENASKDIRTRLDFGSKIKDATVNTEISVHDKGQQAITLPTYRRLSSSVNNEAEALMIYPPLIKGIADKITLFSCSHAELSSNRRENERRLLKELPAMAYDLEHMRVPKALQDKRYGVRTYHNPELFEQLCAISPEQRLLDVLDEILWSVDSLRKAGQWEGGSLALEQMLRASSFSIAVDKIFSFPSACGVYLQRLALQHPDRITKTKNAGKTYWRIVKEQNAND